MNKETGPASKGWSLLQPDYGNNCVLDIGIHISEVRILHWNRLTVNSYCVCDDV